MGCFNIALAALFISTLYQRPIKIENIAVCQVFLSSHLNSELHSPKIGVRRRRESLRNGTPNIQEIKQETIGNFKVCIEGTNG